MTTLSTHVLDIERGVPAEGLPVTLFSGQQQLARAATGADGRIADLAALDAGVYTLVFDAASYFETHGRDAPFLKTVSIEFQVAPEADHYHVPLLLSPYACTSYRGS